LRKYLSLLAIDKFFKIILASFILLVASINVAKAKISKTNEAKSNVEKTYAHNSNIHIYCKNLKTVIQMAR
jgi:hypothetical protein